MPALRIGVVCHPSYGGSGIFGTELGNEMADRGHQVFFIATGKPARMNGSRNIFFHEAIPDSHPLFASDREQRLPFSALDSKIFEVITQEKLDLIHVHYATPLASSALNARLMAKTIAHCKKLPKVVLTLHGTDVTGIGSARCYQPGTLFSVIACDGVTTPSNYLRLAAYDKLRIPTSRHIEIIRNFVDADRFKPFSQQKRGVVRRKLGCLKGEALLMHVSNFRPVKRVEDVMEIFRMVSEKHLCRLVMVGDGTDCESAKRFAEKHSLTDKVNFVGMQHNPECLLPAADVFLLPSETENCPLAALEAMSCRVPVVGSDIAGIPETVPQGKVGFLSEVGDVEGMASHVLTLIRDRKLHKEFSYAARDWVARNFNLPTIVSQYEAFYRRTIRS